MQPYGILIALLLLLTLGTLLAYVHHLRQQLGKERERALFDARENQLRLRTALLASRQALFDIDPLAWHIRLSPEFAAIAEIQGVSDALPLADFHQKIHPTDREHVESILNAHLAGEVPVFRCEVRFATDGGTWKWMLFLGAATEHDQLGNPLRILGTLTDISHVKQLADRVQENAKRLRDITDTLAEGLLLQDMQGRITFANQEAQEMLGWSETELIGHNAHEKIHALQADGSRIPAEHCPIQVAIRSAQKFNGETLFERRDGELIPVSVTVAPFRKNSHLSEAVITFRCIDERIKMQKKLRETLREFNLILNTAQVGIGMIRDNKLVWANKHMKKMFGYQLREIRNKSAQMFFPDDDAFAELDKKAHPVLTRGRIFEEEMRLRHKNGETFWCHMRGAAIDSDNPDEGSIWVLLNIDKMKKTEQEFQQLNRELGKRVIEETRKNVEQERILTHQARLAAMGEMIGNIAHQWRQPLNTLGLVVQNIAEDYRDGLLDQATLDEYRDTAINTVRKMSCTIDDFRNFFQPNRKKEHFNLQNPIHEAYKLIEASLKNNNIAVTIDCPDDLTAWGFPNEFAQVMLNLLGNAKDALVEHNTTSARKIDISARAEGNHALVCVRDNGGGIPPAIMDRIFDPYFTSKKNGTGIGLYMTRVILEQHMHGKIFCRNTGEGGEFTLTFPLQPHSGTTT
jgi:PAS domain S-box-containing protein